MLEIPFCSEEMSEKCKQKEKEVKNQPAAVTLADVAVRDEVL